MRSSHFSRSLSAIDLEISRLLVEAESEKAGAKKSGDLLDRIKKFCELYKGFNFFAHT